MMYAEGILTGLEAVLVLSCVFGGYVPSLQKWGISDTTAHSGAVILVPSCVALTLQVCTHPPCVVPCVSSHMLFVPWRAGVGAVRGTDHSAHVRVPCGQIPSVHVAIGLLA